MEFNIISFIFIYSPADSRSLGSDTGFCVREWRQVLDMRGRARERGGEATRMWEGRGGACETKRKSGMESEEEGEKRRSGAWEERENAGAAEEPGRPRGRTRGWRGEGEEGRGGW